VIRRRRDGNRPAEMIRNADTHAADWYTRRAADASPRRGAGWRASTSYSSDGPISTGPVVGESAR
jgi:hypothetical protein